MPGKSQHKDGRVGGVLVGRKHRDGGIKIKNVSTGQPIEAEGGEVIIMADAVADQTTHEFNGKKMTNLEILSAINESAGGVALYEKGGKVTGPVKCGCTGKKHTYNGKKLTDREILKKMAEGGNVIDAQALRAKQADLVTLPNNIKGTNCSNCQFVHITDDKAGQGYCRHPKVDQPVTARMCCIYWDAPGTERIWQHPRRIMQHGGQIMPNYPADPWQQFRKGASPSKAHPRFAKGGAIDLSDKYGTKLKLSEIPEIVKTFMPVFQQKVIVGSEEHWDVLERLANIMTEMPKTYETENIATDDKIVYLHYFYGESDWYIVEKDMEPDQLQAFGYVILNGDLQNAKWGYINIEEIKETNRVELDFYFEPIKFGELKKKWTPEEEKSASTQRNNLILKKGTWVDLKRKYRGYYDRAQLKEDYYEDATDLYVECCPSDSQPQQFTVAADDIILPDPNKPKPQRYPDDLLIKFQNQQMFDKAMSETGLTEYMLIYVEHPDPTAPNFDFDGKMSPGLYAINPKTKEYLTWNQFEEAASRPSHGQTTEEIEPQNIPQASIKTAKQQAAINQEIINLIKKKGPDAAEYSASEISLIKQYSGAGGLSKHGASGPRILDQFFTPMNIGAKMWGLALQYGFNFNKTAILEPSVGTGNFLQFIPRDAQVQVVGYEVDEITYTICKILFPRYDIRHGSFESMFFTGRRHIGLAGVSTFFDLVIGNPPYREYVSPFAKLGERDATGAFTFEMYFLMRGIDVLKPGGLLIMIIPNTFLSNDNKYNQFKTELAKKADLIDAYRLPNGVFDFTDVGTDIVVFRKKR